MTQAHTRVCAQAGCHVAAKGKGKYCPTHAAESRARFKAMVAKQRAARDARRASFDGVWNGAVATAMAQARDAGGWVRVAPANTAVAYWLLERKYAVKRDGATGVWVRVNVGAQTLANTLARELTPLDNRIKVSYNTA